MNVKMNKETMLKDIEKTFSDCFKILSKKTEDYSNPDDVYSNFESVEKVGIAKTEQGMMARMQDKWSRIIRLTCAGQQPHVKQERVEDTINDLINYLALYKTYIKAKQAQRQAEAVQKTQTIKPSKGEE